MASQVRWDDLCNQVFGELVELILRDSAMNADDTTAQADDSKVDHDLAENDCETFMKTDAVKLLGTITGKKGATDKFTLDGNKSAQEIIDVLDRITLTVRHQEMERCKVEKERARKQRREELNSMDKGAKAFFKHIKDDGTRPTSVLKTKNGFTSNLNDIHTEFLEAWKKVYNRLEQHPPCFETFQREYGQFFGGHEAGDLLPTGTQLWEKARRAKTDSSAGRDGWRPAELALLPEVAWHHRARLRGVMADQGRWPRAYYAVGSPCLRKADKLDPDSNRASSNRP
jgi:hypothetical protein